MSWLAKVSDIAGRAEDLLNQIDQNAAIALRNTKKGAGKCNSTIGLIDIEEQRTKKLEKPQSEIVETTAKHHIRTNHTYSVSGRIRNKKKDDDLIAYLNNSNEPTSSRCSSVASCFSAPNPHIANTIQTTPEPYITEEYLKIQHSDTLRCMHMKESQIAVMSVRLQEAEEANIKKDAQIAELGRELKLMKEELEAGNGDMVNDHSSSLKKLQREHNRKKEEFEKREQGYVKRLESANNENSENEKELQELRAKILKMEVNEQNLTEEIRLAKYNLEANKHEFDEYKQRAQKILSAKENLLTSLKENSSTGSDGVVNSVELEELRCELGLLKDDLQQSQFVIYNLKGDIQEMENRLRDEQRASGAQRENLLKQIHHHLSQANQYREQMERTQLEYDFLQAEMRRQEEAVERKLAEKDIELAKLMEEKKTSKRYGAGEMEQKISLLSEKLISKQTAIERIESEKRALELRLERAEYACRNVETAAVKAVTIEMRGSGANANIESCSLFKVSHSDSMLIRIAKLAICIFDHIGLRLAIFMRSPMFRFFFFIYCLLLHSWVFFILFTYTPEIHPL
ncbi:Golgin subfamily A member 5 protein [Brugia pahangi]